MIRNFHVIPFIERDRIALKILLERRSMTGR